MQIQSSGCVVTVNVEPLTELNKCGPRPVRRSKFFDLRRHE